MMERLGPVGVGAVDVVASCGGAAVAGVAGMGATAGTAGTGCAGMGWFGIRRLRGDLGRNGCDRSKQQEQQAGGNFMTDQVRLSSKLDALSFPLQGRDHY